MKKDFGLLFLCLTDFVSMDFIQLCSRSKSHFRCREGGGYSVAQRPFI